MPSINFTPTELVVLGCLWAFAATGIAILVGRIIHVGSAEPTRPIVDFRERRRQLAATIKHRTVN